ncbi:4'-phosphopantetheinyl transferase [hydrothermal vent metagenome]|uniref:4'-phosphopantetheinyl transferase n=1 Tax=hydrothermal vent metagenome TaxID=652676 RepID=A0A3B0X3I9_9ZZZZ
MSAWHSENNDIQLLDNEIHIWLSYLNVHQARLKHLYPLLSDEEKQRSERFKFYKHRKLFIASHGFLHATLARYIEVPENGITFSYAKYGKPCITDEQNKKAIQFNLSHSGNLAILAVCQNHSLGIDIEFTKRNADWKGIIKRFFTQREQDRLLALPENRQKEAFFKMWTRKEAHMKVTGQGLHLSPDEFEVSVPPEAAEFLVNLKTPDNNYYKMQDIVLPEMFHEYYACLSASFDFKKLTRFVYS